MDMELGGTDRHIGRGQVVGWSGWSCRCARMTAVGHERIFRYSCWDTHKGLLESESGQMAYTCPPAFEVVDTSEPEWLLSNIHRTKV